MILKAIRDLIAEQPWAVRLGAFDFGDGTLRPSVHLTDPPPDSAGSPLITVMQDGGTEDSPSASRGEVGILMSVEIKVWGDQLDSDKSLRNLAQDIHDLFLRGDGKRFNAEDWTVNNTSTSVPKKLTEQGEFPGFSISLNLDATKERN